MGWTTATPTNSGGSVCQPGGGWSAASATSQCTHSYKWDSQSQRFEKHGRTPVSQGNDGRRPQSGRVHIRMAGAG
jgi:hypothetical protein